MGKISPRSEPGRDFVLDIFLSLGAALWLAAADALLMISTPGQSAADYLLRPFGRLGLTSAAYVLVLFLVLGLAAGLLVGFLQRAWLRTPRPWRQTVSLLVSLGLLLLVLCALRAHRLKDIQSFERYFSGLAIAVLLLTFGCSRLRPFRRVVAWRLWRRGCLAEPSSAHSQAAA